MSALREAPRLDLVDPTVGWIPDRMKASSPPVRTTESPTLLETRPGVLWNDTGPATQSHSRRFAQAPHPDSETPSPWSGLRILGRPRGLMLKMGKRKRQGSVIGPGEELTIKVTGPKVVRFHFRAIRTDPKRKLGPADFKILIKRGEDGATSTNAASLSTHPGVTEGRNKGRVFTEKKILEIEIPEGEYHYTIAPSLELRGELFVRVLLARRGTPDYKAAPFRKKKTSTPTQGGPATPGQPSKVKDVVIAVNTLWNGGRNTVPNTYLHTAWPSPTLQASSASCVFAWYGSGDPNDEKQDDDEFIAFLYRAVPTEDPDHRVRFNIPLYDPTEFLFLVKGNCSSEDKKEWRPDGPVMVQPIRVENVIRATCRRGPPMAVADFCRSRGWEQPSQVPPLLDRMPNDH